MVTTRSTAFCDTTLSTLVDRYQHYRKMCCLHLQNQLSMQVPIKCHPIYQATWCHIPYSTLFQAVQAVMLLTWTWEWSKFNFHCDINDFMAFQDFPQSTFSLCRKMPHQYLNYIMANFIQIHHYIYSAIWRHKITCKKKEHTYVTECQSLTLCIYTYIGHRTHNCA